MNTEELNRMHGAIYDGIADACGRIIGMGGETVTVSMSASRYVLDGRTFTVKTASGDYPFWVGINGPRLFFIAYVQEINPALAQEIFAFCFGGAKKVGWEINYEPIENGVSIWATCMTDRATPLMELSQNMIVKGQAAVVLSSDGLFWVTDIAMMAQSWVRTCERQEIKRHVMEPAPL